MVDDRNWQSKPAETLADPGTPRSDTYQGQDHVQVALR